MQRRDLAGALAGAVGNVSGSAHCFRTHSTAGPDERRQLCPTTRYLVCEPSATGPAPTSLYDLCEDPFQQRDVLADEPPPAQRFTAELVTRLQEIRDPWVTAT